jgi:hypothetical protein
MQPVPRPGEMTDEVPGVHRAAWPRSCMATKMVALRPNLLFGDGMFVELVLTGGVRYFEHQPRFGI